MRVHRVLAWLLAGMLIAAPAAALDSFSFDTPGAPEDLQESLRAASLLVSLADDGVTDPQELLAAARAEYSRLLGALYNAGYYGAVISVEIDGREAADIPPLARPASIDRITVRVEPGPSYTFSRATTEPIAPGTELPPGYAIGEPARTAAIRRAAQAAVTGWRAIGYAKARVSEQDIVANHAADMVASDLTLATGQRLRFGEIIVRGEARMSADRVREISGLERASEVFDPEELRRASRRLQRSGVFRSVSITEAEDANPDGTLDITIQVAEQRLRRYGVGLEFSTTEGLSANAYWLHRNLLGGGERLRVEGEWSSIDDSTGGMDYSLGARLTRAATRGPDTDLYVFANLEQLNEPDFTSYSVEAAIGYTRIATDRLSVAAGIGGRFSSVRENGSTREFKFLTLPLEATYDGRDDSLDPRDGFYADAELTPFLGIDGSADGARFLGDGRAYLTFGEARPVTLAGRVQLGSIIGAPINGVPNDWRFYSGGGGTVRGQDYQALGVNIARGPQRVRSGGRSFLGLSGEARVGVTETIGVVAFADWGYVGLDSVPGTSGDSHAGAGLGVRYDTGIGPIRLDVAVPVSGDTGGSDYHIYIGIGQAF